MSNEAKPDRCAACTKQICPRFTIDNIRFRHNQSRQAFVIQATIRMNSNMIKRMVAVLLMTFTTIIDGQDFDMPMTHEDAIILHELEWAEKAMEGYRQKKGIVPIRSAIRGTSYEEWRRDSIDFFATQNSQDHNSIEDQSTTSTFIRGGLLRGGSRASDDGI